MRLVRLRCSPGGRVLGTLMRSRPDPRKLVALGENTPPNAAAMATQPYQSAGG
jgi:hypothetical protein